MATYTIFSRARQTGASTATLLLESKSTVSSSAAYTGPATADQTTATPTVTGLLAIGTDISTGKGAFNAAYQSFLEFDTSSSNIPAGDTITGVTLNLYDQGSYAAVNHWDGTGLTYRDTFNAYAYPFNDNNAGSALSEWRTPAQLAALSKVASWSSTGYTSTVGNQIALSQLGSAFNSALNRTGMTQLVLAAQQNQDNPATAQISHLAVTGPSSSLYSSNSQAVPAANKPNIVVTTTSSTGGTAQTVTPTGIGSGEAWGAASVAVGTSNQTLSPIGIGTSEASGSALVQVAGGNQSILPPGIGSAQAFGTPQVTEPTVTGVANALLLKVFKSGVWVASTGANQSVRRVSTSTQANPYEQLIVDASAGTVQITAPVLANGVRFAVKKMDPSANKVTIVAPSTTIDGASAFSLSTQGASQDLISDGAVWWLV